MQLLYAKLSTEARRIAERTDANAVRAPTEEVSPLEFELTRWQPRARLAAPFGETVRRDAACRVIGARRTGSRLIVQFVVPRRPAKSIRCAVVLNGCWSTLIRIVPTAGWRANEFVVATVSPDPGIPSDREVFDLEVVKDSHLIYYVRLGHRRGLVEQLAALAGRTIARLRTGQWRPRPIEVDQPPRAHGKAKGTPAI